MALTRYPGVYPKIRNIDVFPVDVEGERLVCLRDPTHTAKDPLFVRPAAVFLLSLLDGRHTPEAIQAAYARQFGVTIPKDHLDAFVAQLDEHLLLESERYQQARQAIEEAFRRSAVREPAHAGTAYEADPERLRRQMDGFFAAPDGAAAPAADPAQGPVAGLMAPHIDFHRGGPCYGGSYGVLGASPEAELYIILGIGHAGPRRWFTMTMKDFRTPFGVMKTDRAFVRRVQAASPFDVFEDEFLHKEEHSVEFQVVCLQYLLQGRADAMIVPILCGSFHPMVLSCTSPAEHPEVRGFLSALKQAIAACGKRVCCIAGVDLAHVGMRFGDREPLTEQYLAHVREADLRLLGHVERLDAEAFFQEICRDQDRRRICGYPAIYTLLSLTEAREGRLTGYDQAVDAAAQQAVSFAGMVLR
jgi:AmmeMemoRadiSam system protein B